MAVADRTISSVLHDIVGNLQDIVRSEMRLAKTELTEEIAKSRSAVALLGVGLICLIIGVTFLLLAAVYALSILVPPWAAALIVGASVAGVAAVFFGVGMARFKAVRAPRKTVATLKENVEWTKRQTR